MMMIIIIQHFQIFEAFLAAARPHTVRARAAAAACIPSSCAALCCAALCCASLQLRAERIDTSAHQRRQRLLSGDLETLFVQIQSTHFCQARSVNKFIYF